MRNERMLIDVEDKQRRHGAGPAEWLRRMNPNASEVGLKDGSSRCDSS